MKVEIAASAAHLGDDLLDQKLPKLTPASLRWQLRRIEHRGGGAVGLIGSRLAREWGDPGGDAAGQRDLTKIRAHDQRRMKEGVAAPVRRIDAGTQVVPVAT